MSKVIYNKKKTASKKSESSGVKLCAVFCALAVVAVTLRRVRQSGEENDGHRAEDREDRQRDQRPSPAEGPDAVRARAGQGRQLHREKTG